MITAYTWLGALAPLATIFIVGCLLGTIVVISLYRIALLLWPGARRPRKVSVDWQPIFNPKFRVMEDRVPDSGGAAAPELECDCGVGKGDELARTFRDDDSFCPFHGGHGVWRLPRKIIPSRNATSGGATRPDVCMDCGRTSDQLELGNSMLGVRSTSICVFCLDRRK